MADATTPAASPAAEPAPTATTTADPSPTKQPESSPTPAEKPAATTSADASPAASPSKHTASDSEASPDRKYNDDYTSPDSSPAKSRPADRASPQRHSPKHTRYPPVATVSYPAREPMSVADFLDPSKPLVKSTMPLTKPKGPSFVDDETADERRLRRAQQKMRNAVASSQISGQRVNERKYLKAQYEFEREKKLAERAIYHRERCAQWSQKLGASPLAVDLVADNERIEEEAYVREREEHRRRVLAEKKKRQIKNEIIVKALAEVPLLEEARRQKREMLDEERRHRALRDVQRVEVVQERKLRDTDLMTKERQAKLDQRIMGSTGKHA